MKELITGGAGYLGSDNISSELGWEPESPDIKLVVESAWEWHVANPNGYAR